MEYLKPKRKKDLVNTMRMLNSNSYLLYEDDSDNIYSSNSYVIVKGSYSYGMEQYSYFTFEGGNVIGQYELGDELIIFEIEITNQDFGYNKSVYYEYYSVRDEKFLKFPAKINRLSKKIVNIVNLKEKKDDFDRFALHISCDGCNGIFLKNNTVDFYVGLPRFNLISDVYSTFQGKVLKTRKFSDIQKIIEQDYEDELTMDYWFNEMNYDPRSQEAEVVLLKKR